MDTIFGFWAAVYKFVKYFFDRIKLFSMSSFLKKIARKAALFLSSNTAVEVCLPFLYTA